ncbi:MAG: ATP-dependent DNA helicase [Candidatus Falkowbacteria bacterium]|nr:ATP-dependent DNA helicase [Candidatus Falkowbacteria bacterium]
MKKTTTKTNEILHNLNQAQLEAVTHDSGPMLIVAGAGTGKTTVLINRLAWLIQEKKVYPEQILLTTFTKKGAAELEERADKLLPYGYVNLWINTFDSFGERILRDHALDIGLSPNFKVLDQTEQWMFIRKHLAEFKFDYYKPLGDPTKFIHEIISHFSRLKNENILAEDYLKLAGEKIADADKIHSSDDKADELDASRINELANGYHIYNRLLVKEGFLDFGDLVRYTIKLFKERPNILAKYREQFKYIMVDEFQDTNKIQYELIKLLALPNNNLVAVGDDDQSIYRFRGASLSNIMQFKDDYPKAKEVVLTENYRSGQVVLDHAYTFITHNNPNRLEAKLKLDKKLVSKTKEKGAADFYDFATEFEETKTVADMIKELHDKKVTWANIAILVRANDTADKFVKELTRQNIPNHFVSLKGLYYKQVILDILAYLKLLDDHHEPASLYRALNLASFRVDHENLLILNKWGRKKLWSLFETLQHADLINELSDKTRKNIKHLLDSIKHHSDLAKNDKASKVYLHTVRDLIIEHLDQDLDQESFSFLNQFYSKIKNFESADEQGTLKDFLSLIALEMEAGETGGLRFNFDDADTVKVMTVHAAKGLEFEHVFIVNLVDRKFPVDNRGEKIPIPEELGGVINTSKDSHIEEERRLFYVAMTRAKFGLYCTGARDYGGLRDKKPSKFVNEAELPTIASKAAIKNEFERDLEQIDNTPDRVQYALPEKFSFSQLKTFQNCPWEYKFIYILKMPTEDTSYFTFGRVIHSCLRQFFLPLLTNAWQQPSLFNDEDAKAADLSLKKLLELYDEYWVNSGYRDKQEADDYKALGKKMLQTLQKELGDEKPVIAFLEKKFNLSLGKEILTGAIDRVDKLADGTFEIIDYKTGQKPKTFGFEQKQQLLLYQAALEENFKMKISKLSFYYLKDNEKVSFTAKDGEIDKVKQKMLDLISEIKSFDFTPRPGIMCKNCPYKKMCEFTQI